MRKIFFFSTVLAAFALSQTSPLMAQEPDSKCNVQFEEGEGNMFVTGISDNGRYVVGMEALYTGYIWDTLTGEIVYMTDKNDENSELWDISNAGVAVGGYNAPVTVQADWENSTTIYTDLPQPIAEKLGSAECISPDGKIIVGWSVTENKISGPCLWKDGELTVLETPLVDDTNRKPQRVHLTRMSDDASVLTGFMTSYSGYYELGLIWRAPEYKCEILFADSLYTNKGKWDGYSIKVSPNGKWLGGNIQYYVKSSDRTYARAFRYNLETSEMEVIYDFEIVGGGDTEEGPKLEAAIEGVSTVDNNGTLYITTASGNPWARTAYIAEVGEKTKKLEDYLKEKYDNTDISDVLYFSGTIYATSPDGKILAGHGASMDENGAFDHYYSYVIRLDEAAEGISCKKITNSSLRCYAANGELRLIGNPSMVELTDMSGATVRQMEVNGNTVSLAGLPAGIYAAKLSNGNEVNVQKVIVK